MGNQKINLISEKKTSFEGVFDLKEVYNSLKHYLEGKKSYDLTEKDYSERNTGDSREIISKIEAELYYNDYYKIIIKFSIEMKGKTVEVNYQGQTKTLTKGKAVLTVNALIEPDFLGKKGKTPLAKFLSEVYEHYFGHDEKAAVIAQTAGDVGGLVATFKQQVNSYTA